MNETRKTYLRRIVPDIPLIEGDVLRAIGDDTYVIFFINSAIARSRKLIEDLERTLASAI